jgi:hypothetical protein
MKLKSDEARTIHSLYLAVHQAHQQAPEFWTLPACSRVLTAIMGGRAWSWRVVGITPKALKEFKEAKFKSLSGQGITRGHLRRRIDTAEELLSPGKPLSEKEFLEAWFRHDRTILCAKGENRQVIAEYIPIDNKYATLFSSRSVVGFYHKAREQEILKKLHDARRSRPTRRSGRPDGPARST